MNATYGELKNKGVEFTADPAKQLWGSLALFKDPDGNSFVLNRARINQ